METSNTDQHRRKGIRTWQRLGVLSVVCALIGATLSATAAEGNTAPVTVVTATSTIFDLNGAYIVGLPGRPVITNVNDILTVNMSTIGRPTATGIVVNSDTIIVTFSDDATYGAKLLAPGIIRWSNRSEWYKAAPAPSTTAGLGTETGAIQLTAGSCT